MGGVGIAVILATLALVLLWYGFLIKMVAAAFQFVF